MVLDDQVFAYVASADPNEARLAALAADVRNSTLNARLCVIVANQVTIDHWRDVFRLAADAAQRAGDLDTAAACRESFDHIELAMQAGVRVTPAAAPPSGPLM